MDVAVRFVLALHVQLYIGVRSILLSGNRQPLDDDKGGDHSCQVHIRHIRRRNTHSDAFSGGAWPERRFCFESSYPLEKVMAEAQLVSSNATIRRKQVLPLLCVCPPGKCETPSRAVLSPRRLLVPWCADECPGGGLDNMLTPVPFLPFLNGSGYLQPG